MPRVVNAGFMDSRSFQEYTDEDREARVRFLESIGDPRPQTLGSMSDQIHSGRSWFRVFAREDKDPWSDYLLGHVDPGTWEVTTPPVYSNVHPFHNGLAAVNWNPMLASDPQGQAFADLSGLALLDEWGEEHHA